jgi:serine/threonine-protein kinase
MPRVCAVCGRKFEGSVTRCPDDGSPTLVYAQDDELIGKTIDGRFTVKDLLGRGGMGAVYRAHQHSMDRDVALKVLRRDAAQNEEAVKRFFREARAVSKLASPNTITVHDFGQTEDGLLYIAMEMLRGRSLSQVIRELNGPMEPAKAVRITQQILESLAEAHQMGIIHRDLKPDNIFVLEGTGRNEFVKVLDFGIAKLQGADGSGSHLTGTGMTFGTPTYMSPEQAQAKELDGRTDLYSLGVILFEMLAGKPPFDGQTPLDVMMKKVQRQPPTIFHVNPDVRVPAQLERLLASLLAQSRADRPSSAEVVTRLLAQIMDEPSDEQVPIPDVVVSEGTTSQVAALESGHLGEDASSLASPTNLLQAAGSDPWEGPALSESGPAFTDLITGRRSFPWRWVGVAAVAVAGLGLILWLATGRDSSEPPTASTLAPSPITVPVVPSQGPTVEEPQLVVPQRVDTAVTTPASPVVDVPVTPSPKGIPSASSAPVQREARPQSPTNRSGRRTVKTTGGVKLKLDEETPAVRLKLD